MARLAAIIAVAVFAYWLLRPQFLKWQQRRRFRQFEEQQRRRWEQHRRE